MPSFCCAYGCNNRGGSGKKKLPIPSGKRNAARRKVWLHRIGRAHFDNVLDPRLCEDHFTEDQFESQVLMNYGIKKLRPDAVPSLFVHRKRRTPRKPPTKRGVMSKSTEQAPIKSGPAAGLATGEHADDEIPSLSPPCAPRLDQDLWNAAADFVKRAL
ncbi:THAP domain-containing protein 5-like [Amblyomma americanum]